MRLVLAFIAAIGEIILSAILMIPVLPILESDQRYQGEPLLVYLKTLWTGILITALLQFVAASILIIGLCGSDPRATLKKCNIWIRIAYIINFYYVLVLITWFCPKLTRLLPPLGFCIGVVCFRFGVFFIVLDFVKNTRKNMDRDTELDVDIGEFVQVELC